jgi:exosortase A
MTIGLLAPLPTPAPTPVSRRVLWRDLRVAVPALVVALIYFALMFGDEATAAVRVWIDSTAYNHGFFVLPLALWLAWDRRGAARGLRLQPTLWPALATLPFGLAWFVADRLGIMEGRQLAALGMLEALLVALLGWRLARSFAAALAYLVFLVPFGAFVTPWLQVFTAHFIDAGLSLLGIPHLVSDFTIEIPDGAFYVAEACAGLRFLIAAVAFGALYACLVYRSPGRRLAFMAASVLVPVLANGVRALGIVVLGHLLGNTEAAAADHLIYGWGFFSVVILLLIAAGLPFREDIAPPPARRGTAEVSTAPLELATPWAAAVAVTLLAAAGPIAVALLDRSGTPTALTLPAFVATEDCAATGDPPAMPQQFRCGAATLLASVRALPSGSSPAALLAAMLDATGERGLEDVAVSRLAVPGATPPAWRLVQLPKPERLVAIAAFVDGQPAPGGLAGRLRLALDSVTGKGGPVVLVAATLQSPELQWPTQQETGRAVLRRFLQAQAPLLNAVATVTAEPARP